MLHLMTILIHFANTIIPWIVGTEVIVKGFLECMSILGTILKWFHRRQMKAKKKETVKKIEKKQEREERRHDRVEEAEEARHEKTHDREIKKIIKAVKKPKSKK